MALCDKETNEIFYGKLGYKFIVLPSFNNGEDKLETIVVYFIVVESARKFKAMGMAIEDIAKGLDLSIEEVEKI